jgi:hypothetical protein
MGGYNIKETMQRIKLTLPDLVPLDQIDIPFIQGMIDRMAFGYFNYGHMRRYEVKSHSLKNVEIRLKHYKKTKNTEFLMDAANYCMMEFCVPSIIGAKYTPTTKKESPGAIVDGKHVRGKEDYTPAMKSRLEKASRAKLTDRRIDHGE